MGTGRVTTCRCIAFESDLTWAVQDWLAEGRQEGRQEEAASVILRLLPRLCGPLSEATTAQIHALSLEQLVSPGRLAGHQHQQFRLTLRQASRTTPASHPRTSSARWRVFPLLDTDTEQSVMAAIEGLSRELTIVLLAQQPRYAEFIAGLGR